MRRASPQPERGARCRRSGECPTAYWLALGFVVAAFVVVTLLVRSRAGHAMAAVRENEARAAVLGFDTYRVKLLAIVVGARPRRTGRIVHALVLGGSTRT